MVVRKQVDKQRYLVH